MKKQHFLKKISKILVPFSGCLFLGSSCVACSIEIKPDPIVPTGYTITYNILPDEEIVSGSLTQLVDKDSLFSLANSPFISKQNYIFNGWSLQEEDEPQQPIPSDYVVSGDINVFPIWKIDIHKDTKIQAFIDNEWFPLQMSSLCSEEESQNIIVYEQDATTIKEEIARDEFDLPIKIGGGITYLPDFFLANCVSFKQSISFAESSQLTYIGNSFLANCVLFNTELSLPNELQCLSKNFLGGCETYNHPLVLPSTIQILGSDFLSDCIHFNKDFILPSNLTYVGENCMINCNDFSSTLTVDCADTSLMVGEGYGWSARYEAASICSPGFYVNGKSTAYFELSFPTRKDPVAGIYRTIRETI